MNSIKLKTYGKINLILDVLGTLPNGYHDLDMVMQTVDIYDELTITKTNNDEITISSNTGAIPNDNSNLAYKAAKALKDKFGIEENVDIYIDKNIPIAAGMAGGSADCAGTLKGMNELFGLGLSEDELCEIGVKLGADVPYCIKGGTKRAQGIGEVLTELKDVPQAYVLLAKPPISVSTGFVYGRIDEVDVTKKPDTEAMISAIEDGDIKGVASNICNVLEEVTIPDYPIVADIKNKMIEQGALNAMMTGSGPTVFGIFDDEQKALNCQKELVDMNTLEKVALTQFV